MTCPAGCLRTPGHEGFHTTVPAIAEKADRAEHAAFLALLDERYDWVPVPGTGISVARPKAVTCNLCGRPLESPKDFDRGYGPVRFPATLAAIPDWPKDVAVIGYSIDNCVLVKNLGPS